MKPAPSAAYQRHADAPESVRTDAGVFDRELGTLARKLRLSVPNLTDDERYLLDEYGRGASKSGEARFRMVTFRSLCAIARRSRKPEDREALAEIVRAEILSGLEPTPVEIAFDAECPVPGEADPAQRAFERHPNPITWRRCRDALRKQIAVSRVALDAITHLGFRSWS